MRLGIYTLATALLLTGLLFYREAVLAQGSVTPTPDRLARPTLPPTPSQADYGAQVYWLSCLPCHGDRGQGLTEEFRQTYPPEDRNCWESGCHGERPYESGFRLPTKVPAVIGKGTVDKFPNAAALQAYIRAAMPYWKPGSLSDEEAWQVTAFLLRENGLWNDSTEIESQNAAQITWTDTNTSRSGIFLWLSLLSIFALLFFVLRRWLVQCKSK
ncbi:MAG: hypothetical protein WHS87_02415 [Anaerolineales bacterium]